MTRRYTAWSSSDPPEPCKKCGELHYRQFRDGNWHVTCVGHTREGKFCRSSPIKGGTVCKMHGGSTGHIKKKAQERWEHAEVLRKATRGLTSAGVDLRDVDPIRELLWSVAVSSSAVKWLGYQIAELKLPDLVSDPAIANVDGIDNEGNPVTHTSKAELFHVNDDASGHVHPLWQQWNYERARHAKFAKLAVDAGVSERMVRIAEAQSEMVVEVVMYALDRLRVSEEIREEAIEIIAARFREIDTENTPLALVGGD